MVDHPIAGLNASVAMMTKGGIEAMSKNIAMEYAKEQIRANTVAPGVVDTPLREVFDTLFNRYPAHVCRPDPDGRAGVLL